MQTPSEETDVLICGGGPVGLLLGYQLRRMGVQAVIAEKNSPEDQGMIGRACTLLPRSLELLDQIDLLEEMLQIGYIASSSLTYKNGKLITNRGWNSIYSHMHNTNLPYVLNIRQKYSEGVFRARYEALGAPVKARWILRSISYEDSPIGRRVHSIIQEIATGNTKEIISKYIIGADGGSSTVRELAKIKFEKVPSQQRWIRIDGVLKTSIPDNDIGFASIESPIYGNVLWCVLDHGRRRIGFSLPKNLQEKYPDSLTEEQAKHEAILAVAPFSLEWVKVDWHTDYSLQQGIAENFYKDECVFLAGDACHIHSSALAQGMNTGIHDAVNLGWKLAGVIKGLYHQDILETYESERKPVAQHLLSLDKDVSQLISGLIPEKWSGKGNNDPNELINMMFDSSISFHLGFGIRYSYNVLNEQANAGMVTSGERAPDVLLRKPGSRISQTLFSITKNSGIFWVVLFAGQPLQTSDKMRLLTEYLSKQDLSALFAAVEVKYLTIVAGCQNDTEIGLGVTRRLGNVYYDQDNSAHNNYSLTLSSGGIAVLRPDGILGYLTTLSQPHSISEYFSRICC